MAYERFENKSKRFGEPSLTIRIDGRIRLNAAAVQLLKTKAVTQVWILWDPELLKLALKPARSADKTAYKLTFSKEQNMADIGAKAFIRHLGWTSAESFSTTVSWNDKEGLLETDKPLPRKFLTAKRKAGKPES